MVLALLMMVSILGIGSLITASATTVPSGKTFYLDVTNFTGGSWGNNSTYYMSLSGNSSYTANKSSTTGAASYKPSNDTSWVQMTKYMGNIYKGTTTAQNTNGRISFWTVNESSYSQVWEVSCSLGNSYNSSYDLFTIGSGYTNHSDRHASCFSGTWSTFSMDSALGTASSNVVAGTQFMFYIESYSGNADLVNSSAAKPSTYNWSYISDGKALVTTTQSALSSYNRITNNQSGGWSGQNNQSSYISAMTRGGADVWDKGDNGHNDPVTGATTLSSSTIESGTSSITLGTTCTGTSSSIGADLYYQYYLDGTKVSSSTTRASTSSQSFTLTTSSLSVGEHTLKTIMVDTNGCFYIGDTDTITVTNPQYTSLSASKQYTVNGSTYSTLSSGTAPTIGATSVEQGSSVSVSAASISGYTFYTWYSANGSFASATSASTTFTPTANSAVAIARYKKNYTFSGTKNGTGSGTLTVPSGTKVAGESFTINVSPSTGSTLTAFTVNGVDKLSSVSNGSYTANASFSTTTSIPVVATFTLDTYTISYAHGSNGTGTVSSTSKSYGVAATLSSSTFTSSRDGYEQDGWSTTDGGAKAYDLGGSYTANSSTTLYPHWKLIDYNVKKSETGGTGTITIGDTTLTTSNQSKSYGTYTITVTAPSGKNISAISSPSGSWSGIGTGTATLTGYTLSNDLTVTVTYVDAGSCSITAKKTNSSGATLTTESMTIGDTLTVYAAGNSFHTSGSFSVSSNNAAATVSFATVAKNGTFTVTAVKPGTATITISCSADGASTTFDVSVGTPTINIVSANNADIGGTVLLNANFSNSTTTPTYSWSVTNGTAAASVSSSTLSAGATAGTATVKVRATFNASYYIDVTQAFTVNTPTISVDNKTGLKIGETYTPTPTLSNPSSTSSDWTVVYSRTSGTYSTTDGSSITGDTYNASATTFRASFQYKGAEKAYTTFTVNTADVSFTFNTTAQTINVGGTVTKAASGGTHGSGATATYTYSSNATGVATVNSNGKVTGVAPGTATITATYTVKIGGVQKAQKTKSYTVTVTAPTVSITSANNANIGNTVTLGASSTGATTTPTYTYSIGATTYASLSNGVLSAEKAGTVTITVTAKYNNSYSKTATQTFTVNTPTISFATATTQSINVGETYTRTATTKSSVGTVTTDTTTYSSSVPAKASVNNSGVVTGLTPGSTVISATRTIVCNGKTTTVDSSNNYTVTVKTPVVSISPATATIATGDKKTLTGSATNVESPSYSYASDDTSVATVNASTGQVTAVSAGTAHITVTATKGSWSDTASATITVEAPSMTIADTANASTKYLTVGTNYAKALTSNFNATYTVTSSNTSVATASESSGTLTVVPVAKGTATITVTGTKTAASISASSANKSKGLSKGKLATGASGDIEVTQTFTVNVAAASTDVVVLLQDFTYNSGDGWGSAYIHAWKNDGDTAIANRAQMTKIGTNGSGRSVYAYKFTSTDWANVKHLTFMRQSGSDWNSEWDRTVMVFDGTHGSATSFQLRSDSDGSHRKVDTSNTTIPIPQVAIDDATTALGTNYTMTATKLTETNVGEYRWSSEKTSVATVTADTNTTPSTTVTPVDAGTSTITVKAFAVAPTNWTLTYDDTTLPYIGLSDTATITVTADDRTVTYSQKVSYDGTSYDAPVPGVTPGTLTVTKTTGGAAVANGSTVPHNTSVTFHAVANTGFTFVGWEVDGVIDNPLSTADKVITVNADRDVKALFQSDMQVHFSNKLSTNGTTYDAPGYAAAGTISASYGGSSGDSGSGSGSGSGSSGAAPGGDTTYYMHIGVNSNFRNADNSVAFQWDSTNGVYYASYALAANSEYPMVINTTSGALGDGNKASSTQTIITKDASFNPNSIQFDYFNYNTNGYDDYDCFKFKTQTAQTVYFTFTAAGAGLVVRSSSSYTPGGSGSGSGSSDPTIVNDGDYVPYGTEVTFSASANTGYVFAGWKVNNGDNEYVTTDKTVTVTSETTVNALFKKIHYITLYNTYEEEAGNNFKFVSPPPRQVKVGTGSGAITYTYAAGTAEQRGEDIIATATGTSGTYYEGNRIPVPAGTEVKLTYSALASSDAISGVFFNNSIRYTHEYEDDNLYKNRVEYTGASDDKWGNEGDDNFGTSINPYTYLSATTLFADASFYSGDTANTISGQTYRATVNNTDHTVTWTAVDDYLNIDLELASKYRIIINNDDWNGIEVTNSTYNAEGYYYPGERINGDDGIEVSLDTSDSSKHFTFTDVNTIQRKTGDNTYETVTDVQLVKSNGKYYIRGTDADNKDMPAYDIYVGIGVKEEYNLKLGNVVVSDEIGHKTMLNQTDVYNQTNGATAESSASGHIGTVTAIVSDGNDTNIAYENNSTYHWYYDGAFGGSAGVYENNPDQHSFYLKRGGVNKTGSMVEAGQTVTYTFNFASGKDAEYSFVGWFEGKLENNLFVPDYTKKLSGKTTFTYTPKKDTVVIAAGTRDMYLGGNFTNGGAYTTTAGQQTWSSNRIQMEFDPTYSVVKDGVTYKGRYYYKFDTVTANTEYQFRAYDTVSGTDTTNLNVWKTWTGSDYATDADDVFYGRHKYTSGDAGSHGAFVYKNNTNNWSLIDNTVDDHDSNKNHAANGYAAPVTVYFYAYDGGISVTSEYQWSKAYVSAGRGIDCTNYSSVISSGATPSYNTPTVSVANKTVGNKDVDGTTTPVTYGEESVYKCTVKEKDGKIVVSACPDTTDLELDAFVVYNIDTKESEAVKHSSTTGTGAATKYVANITVPQNSSIYVVPVYKFTENYITGTGLKSHTVYVRTRDIDKNLWGGLVAMFSWGSKTDSGGWPGQLLIPSDDGNSFYGQLAFGAGDLRGITFNNYCRIYGGAQKTFLGTYGSDVSTKAYSGNSTHVYQTYDYREPISIIENIDDKIYEDEDMDLTFALKSGNMTAAPTIDSAGSGAYNRASNFEYLTDRSGKKRVDLNGNVLATNSTETYRIVAYYTNAYASSGSYDFSDGSRDGTGYSGSYSVNWTVYDATGASTGVSGVLSAAYVDTLKSEGLTYIASKLIEAGLPVSGKAVKIAYENPGTWSETIRYSGQWYADGVNTLVEAKARVGIYSDGAWIPSDTNAPGYGTATVACPTMDAGKGENLVAEFSSGNSLAKVIKSRGTNGQVQFTVDTTDNFLGWYRDDGEGGYVPVGSNYKNQTITPSFNDDITYYAFYSASASYVFEYTSRNGGTKQYTAKGTDLTDAELANNGTLDATARSADITSKLSGINNIKVFNRTLTYELNTPNTSDPYVIKYTAGGSANTYEVNVYNGSKSKIGTVISTFGNKAVDLYKEALTGKPANSNIDLGSGDNVFIGWKKYNTGTKEAVGDYLSTQPNFGYNVTENMDIIACYGSESDKETARADLWKAYIDKNVITQELTSETTGQIYNDSIIAFRNGIGTNSTLPLDGNKECGIVILAQANSATDDQKTDFDTRGQASLLGYANNFIKTGTTSGKMNTKYGEAYAFKIKANSLSDLNRIDLCQILDYAKFSGGKFKVMSYYYDASVATSASNYADAYKCSEVISKDYTVD